jgi:hypothetical protein
VEVRTRCTDIFQHPKHGISRNTCHAACCPKRVALAESRNHLDLFVER